MRKFGFLGARVYAWITLVINRLIQVHIYVNMFLFINLIIEMFIDSLKEYVACLVGE
jgi:hypothetical protein